MTSKEATIRFLDELPIVYANSNRQIERLRQQLHQTNRLNYILAYGERNQGILHRVANEHGTHLFPFSRTIRSPYFPHFEVERQRQEQHPSMHNLCSQSLAHENIPVTPLGKVSCSAVAPMPDLRAPPLYHLSSIESSTPFQEPPIYNLSATDQYNQHLHPSARRLESN